MWNTTTVSAAIARRPSYPGKRLPTASGGAWTGPSGAAGAAGAAGASVRGPRAVPTAHGRAVAPSDIFGERLRSARAAQVQDQFAQQAERHHLHADDDEQHADGQRGARTDRVTGELQRGDVGEQARAEEPEDDPDAAEQVERPARVGREELDRDEVEEPAP